MRVSCKLIVALGILAAVLLACEQRAEPLGQVVLHIDTDAPVRPSTAPDEPAPLFDRARIEIFPPGASEPCSECVREFELDADKMHQGQFSLGIALPPRMIGYRARIRIFRSLGLGPRPHASLETTGYLPALREEGIVHLTATLRTDAVGRPTGTLGSPLLFDKGEPRNLEGTWPGAAVGPCSASAPANAVCVPGGAFVMGDPRVVTRRGLTAGLREHIVVLRPFFMDAHEVTVAEMRASSLAAYNPRGRATDPLDDSENPSLSRCNFTSAAGAHEEEPVMCITWALARSFCQARGGDLPTEAQFEYVASRRGSRLWPWGETKPTCEQAFYARGEVVDNGGCGADPFRTGPLFPARAGSGSLDGVPLPGGVVVDLAANVAEYMRDAFQDDDEPCWTAPLLYDPVCMQAGRAAEARSARGGSIDDLTLPYVQVRKNAGASVGTMGFRCVYPAE